MTSDIEVIPARRLRAGWWLPSCLAVLAGCSEQDMVVQPKYKTYQESAFFADGMSARPIVAGTVARGQLRTDTAYYQGQVSTDKGTEMADVDTIPIRVFDPKANANTPEDREERRKILERGRDRYNIYCTPCHDRTGSGRGMIVLRGFSPPPTYHQPRLRDAPVGHFFHVITNGYGAMYPYGSRIPPDDRWAIVAYIRALQVSHDAKLDDVPADERKRLEAPAR